MSLPPLATQDDLEAALQRTLDPTQAAVALKRASARVRRYARQDFTFVQGDTIELPGRSQILRLPQRPVVVDADNPLTVIELFGVADEQYECLEHRDYTRIGSQLTRGEAWWAPTRLMGWPWLRPQGIWADRVLVTYSHGYTEVPDDVEDIVLDLAAMNLSNPKNLRAEAVDDYSVTYSQETIGGALLTADHKDALRGYRIGTFNLKPVQ